MRFEEITAAAPGVVETAAAHLASGGLLAHPTGGVYGIGGAATAGQDRLVERLKGRSGGPGIVHLVADVAALRACYPEAGWPPLAARLAAEFWPGLLTLVLDDGSEFGVAVRVEPHPVTRRVLERFGRAMGSTSLNLAGAPAATDPETAREVLTAFGGAAAPVLFVDAGRLPGPPPSTLVRVPGHGGMAYAILRQGAVEAAEIARAAERMRDVEPR